MREKSEGKVELTFIARQRGRDLSARWPRV